MFDSSSNSKQFVPEHCVLQKHTIGADLVKPAFMLYSIVTFVRNGTIMSLINIIMFIMWRDYHWLSVRGPVSNINASVTSCWNSYDCYSLNALFVSSAIRYLSRRKVPDTVPRSLKLS